MESIEKPHKKELQGLPEEPGPELELPLQTPEIQEKKPSISDIEGALKIIRKEEEEEEDKGKKPPTYH